MGFFKSGSSQSRPENGKTIIAEGCVINGEITGLSGALHIDGRVEGIIDSGFDLSIGEAGYVNGLVKAKRVVLSGVFEGKIACETIDVLSTGKLIGELICEEFTVETGGKFIGQSHEMTEGGMVVSLPETFAQMSDQKNVMSVTGNLHHKPKKDEQLSDASSVDEDTANK